MMTSNDFLHDKRYVFVKDPIKITDTIPGYIIYKVVSSMSNHSISSEADNTITSHKINNNNSERIVERRFSDFEWLHRKLKEEYRECVVPPLPSKQQLGRFESQFIESRRKALEKFMNRLTHHHKFSNSSYLQKFLFASTTAMITARIHSEDAAVVNTGTWYMNKILKSTKAFATEIVSPLSADSNRHENEYENKYKEAIIREDLYKDLANRTVTVLNKSKSYAECLMNLGQSLKLMSQGEEEEDYELIDSLNSSGSLLTSMANTHECCQHIDEDDFRAHIIECAGMMESIRDVICKLNEVKVECDEASDDVTRAHDSINAQTIYGNALSFFYDHNEEMEKCQGVLDKAISVQKEMLDELHIRTELVSTECSRVRAVMHEETADACAMFVIRKAENYAKMRRMILTEILSGENEDTAAHRDSD